MRSRNYALLFLTLILGGFFMLLNDFEANATVRYKKDTGKKCTFCHTGIPEPGDEDAQLTEEGKKFKANDYKLTEEQKRQPGR